MESIRVRTASQIGRSNVRTAKSHERRVAHLLTEWSGHEFRRRRVEGRMRDTIARDLTGDVVPVEGVCRFNIEAKKGKDFSLDALMGNPAGCLFTSWYFQSSYDADLCSQYHKKKFWPMVFFKPIPAWDWIAFATGAIADLKAKDGSITNGVWWPHLLFDGYLHCGEVTCNVSHTKNRKNMVMVTLQLQACIICRWDDFAANVDPQSFFF